MARIAPARTGESPAEARRTERVRRNGEPPIERRIVGRIG
jgi:hypothetical protein